MTSRPPGSLGFSIMELMVSISILALLSVGMVPTVIQWSAAYNKRNAEMLVLQDLRRAQATTVEQGCQGIFTVDGDSRGYSFGCDYVPYSGDSPPVYDNALFRRDLPANTLLSAAGLIMFNSRGQVVDEDGFLSTQSITLSSTETGAIVAFNTGTLDPTGFFKFAH